MTMMMMRRRRRRTMMTMMTRLYVVIKIITVLSFMEIMGQIGLLGTNVTTTFATTFHIDLECQSSEIHVNRHTVMTLLLCIPFENYVLRKQVNNKQLTFPPNSIVPPAFTASDNVSW